MIDGITDVLYLLTLAMSGGAMVYAWLTSRAKANTAALRELEKRLADAEKTLLVQGSQITGLAAIHGELGSVHRRVDEAAKEISELTGAVGQMGRQLGLIHAHLLGGACRTAMNLESPIFQQPFKALK